MVYHVSRMNGESNGRVDGILCRGDMVYCLIIFLVKLYFVYYTILFVIVRTSS